MGQVLCQIDGIMKLKSIFVSCSLALAIAGACHARTWTSADGKSTFEGDFVSATDTKVTVKRSNKDMTFDISRLSTEDQSFIKEEVEKADAAAKAKEESEKLKESKIPKALAGKLVKLDSSGKKYEKFELADGIVPKYYLVYFSASW